jgi:eukaryotic-like serine/threonine-protein kinase
MADRTGQQFGHYRLVRLLGRGGFAEVYLGEHLRLKTQTAIKVLYTALEKDDIEGFLREAQTVARLKHPHIVRVFDFDVENHTPYLVMDYLPNGSIRRLYPKGSSLPLETIVSYVNQVASALQYAHDQKLIHRDVKPENMLLDQDNSMVLSDFGIALMAQSSRYQSTQQVAGTAAYMAPEQFQGHPHRASDQYALGVVVYEWLSGDRPFHGTFSEIASQHLFVPPPPLSEKMSTISSGIEQVVQTALEKDPQKRFGSVEAFARALEQACQAIPPQHVVLPTEVPFPSETSFPSKVSATALPTQLPQATNVETPPSHSLPPTVAAKSFHPPDVSPPLTRESVPSIDSQSLRQSRHLISRRVVLVGLAGLTVTGGGIAWFAMSHPSTSPFTSRQTAIHRPTFTPKLAAEPTPLALGTLLYTYRGHSQGVMAIAWSPNGSRIASGSHDKTVQVWDASDGSHAFTYHGHSDWVPSVAWSPDSIRIASGSVDTTVQIWNAADGRNIYTYRGHSDQVWSVMWSPDGSRIVSSSWDKTVQVWNASDGTHIFTYRGHSNVVWAAAWSPDGSRIASTSVDAVVQVWDAVNGSHAFTYRGHSSAVYAVAWSPDGKRIASASADTTVQVWNAVDGTHIFTYRGHTDQVWSVGWSPDGKHIASGSFDSTVQVWNAVDGTHIFTYRGHTQRVNPIVWSPDGSRIASGGDDTTVQVWQAV